MKQFLEKYFELEKEFESRFRMTCQRNELDLPMNTRLYKHPQLALYVAHRDIETDINLASWFPFNPAVSLFAIFKELAYEALDGPLAQTHYHPQNTGSLLHPLEDPLSDDEFLRTFGTDDYKPLIDDREPLNAAFLLMRPYYIRTEDTEVATRISLVETLNDFTRRMRLVEGSFDFDVHRHNIFPEFIAGVEFPVLAENEEMIKRSKEIMR